MRFVLLLGVFAAGATCGFLAGGGGLAENGAPAAPVTPRTSEAPREDDGELRRLRSELALAREERDAARIEVKKIQSQPAATGNSTAAALAPTVFNPPDSRRFELDSLDEVHSLVPELVARADLEGLWLLAAELLAQGEGGFEKLVDLLGWLETNAREFSSVERLWQQEEIFVGRFLRSVAQHHEDLLRFGLYFEGQSDLPGSVTKMRREMLREIGPVLLGFYEGNDPEILGGYTRLFTRIVADETTGERTRRKAAIALGQIPTAEATDFLLEMLKESPDSLVRDVVSALAWQGSDRALPALRSIRETVADDRTLQIIDAAIRYLEG